MRVLLDECVHAKLASRLRSHDVKTVQEAGWRGTKNGELLKRAAEFYDVFITSDKNIQYQNHPDSLPLPVLMIATRGTMWSDIEPILPRLITLLESPLSNTFHFVR